MCAEIQENAPLIYLFVYQMDGLENQSLNIKLILNW